MKALLRLALQSLWNRRLTVGLTVLTLTVSVTLLLAVEQTRGEARSSFTQTLSGTDLIVGARTSPVQLLLYSIFHIGNATNEVSWQSYREIAASGLVEWTVPIALGDSHRGFRVMGTSPAFFERYRYARTREVEFAAGRAFDDVYEAVVGAQVANELQYRPGREIVLSHGIASISFLDHGDKPFTVVGVLRPTGTPVDRTVLVSLEGIQAIHVDWQQGRPPSPGGRVSADQARSMDLTPQTITAFLVGLKSRIATFTLQRAINEYPDEPLTAILPGVALSELWRVIGSVENILLVISAFVVLAGLIGMVTALLTGLNERRREMAILRAVGARPYHLFVLFVLEGGLIGLLASTLGLLLVTGGLLLGRDTIAETAGIYLTSVLPGATGWMIIALVIVAALVASAFPAWRAYRMSLADGLTVRI